MLKTGNAASKDIAAGANRVGGAIGNTPRDALKALDKPVAHVNPRVAIPASCLYKRGVQQILHVKIHVHI